MRPVATYIKAEFEAHENIHMTPDIDGNPALRLIGDVRFAFVFQPKEDQPTKVAFCRRCREIMKMSGGEQAHGRLETLSGPLSGIAAPGHDRGGKAFPNDNSSKL